MNDAPSGPRRWWRPAVAVVGAVAVLLGLAEVALRLIIPGVIAGGVRESFDLADDHQVTVDLGGSALWHTVTGQLGQVTVSVDDVELAEGLRGDLAAYADAVPFDFEHSDLTGASVRLTVERQDLPDAVSVLTNGLADSGKVQGDDLVIGRTAQIFGMDVEMSVSLGLRIVDGDVEIDPRALSAVGFDLTPEELSPSLDISAQTFCVRDHIPAGITLTGIELLANGAVTLTADLAPDIVSNPAQQEVGSCDA